MPQLIKTNMFNSYEVPALFIGLVVMMGVLYTMTYKKEHFVSNGTGSNGPNKTIDETGIHLKDTTIYLINLDRNPERLEAFIEQYMMSDLRYKQFQRLSAVDGREIENIQEHINNQAFQEIQQIEKTGYRTKHYQLTRGAIGCYMSHMKAYKEIADGASKYGLIFEDDVRIDRNILRRLNNLLSGIPNDWDMLLLGCHCIICDKYDVYYDTDKFFLLHCYVIKKASAKKLHLQLSKIKIKQQIDSELSDLVMSGSLKIYCLRESLSKQSGEFDTDIQTPLKVMPGIDPYVTLL